jgi:uncharacterized protein (DUF983 family)
MKDEWKRIAGVFIGMIIVGIFSLVAVKLDTGFFIAWLPILASFIISSLLGHKLVKSPTTHWLIGTLGAMAFFGLTMLVA